MFLSRPIPRLLAIVPPVATGCVSSSLLELYRTGNIALCRNYIRLLGLDYTAPRICASS